MIKFGLLLIVSITIIGCRQSAVPDFKNTPATELDVAVSLLDDGYKDYFKRKTPIVVEDTFSIGMLRMDETCDQFTKSLLSEASDQVPADLIRDFCEKNAKPQPVWPELKKRLRVVLISRVEMDGLFAVGHGKKPDGWDKFYAKYPNSPGIITISRIGFNKKGDMAMIYVGSQHRWLAGSGGIRVFHKQDGKWVAVPVKIGPTWVS